MSQRSVGASQLLALLAALVAGCAGAPTAAERLQGIQQRLVEARVLRAQEDVPAGLARVARGDAALLVRLHAEADRIAEAAEDMANALAPDDLDVPLTPLEQDGLRGLTFELLRALRFLARTRDHHFEVCEVETLPASLRAAALSLQLDAALSSRDLTARFVAAFEDRSRAIGQLDQPHERDHIPALLYHRMKDSLGGLRRRARVRRLIDRFQAADIQREIVQTAATSTAGTIDLAAIARRIYDSPSYDPLRQDESLGRLLVRGPEKVLMGGRDLAHSLGGAVYPVQVFVSSLIGDMKTSFRAPRIPVSEVPVLRARLRPGDILLRRCDFFVSNAFLPGWWGHAALYVGDRAALEKAGIAADPRVEPHLAEMTAGHELIEAVGEGVRIDGLSHFMEADHVAALRPRWRSRAERAEAVARAFSDLGKAYDFHFDFATDDTLVCSELVYRALARTVPFKLTERFGRQTLTPDDIAELSDASGGPLRLKYFYQDGRVASPAAFARIVDPGS